MNEVHAGQRRRASFSLMRSKKTFIVVVNAMYIKLTYFQLYKQIWTHYRGELRSYSEILTTVNTGKSRPVIPISQYSTFLYVYDTINQSPELNLKWVCESLTSYLKIRINLSLLHYCLITASHLVFLSYSRQQRCQERQNPQQIYPC